MDVTAASWRTSSYSGSNGGTCVEVGTAGPAVAVRDSKHPDGPLLAFTVGTWQAFTDQVKATAITERAVVRVAAGTRLAPRAMP